MNSGDIAWLLASAALVLLMTPGLALFYGGMVRARNVLNMLMMNLAAIPIVTILWVVVTYSLMFDSGGGSVIGGLGSAGLTGLGAETLAGSTLNLMFAIITVALISGAVADRMRFSAWVTFVAAWSLIVYPLIGRSLFVDGGVLRDLGAQDFAGGLVVHVSAGVSAIALVIVLGPRRAHRREPIRPHSLPLTMIGAALLWFGWFGFNAGSAGAANETAVTAFLATQVAAAAGMAGWLALEWRLTGSPTLLGAVSGVIAGLVAVTPAAGYVSPLSALAIGAAGGMASYATVRVKHRFPFDDALDVVGIHLAAGVLGSLLVAVFASASFGGSADGLIAGSADLIWPQIASTAAVAAVAFVLTWVIAKVLDRLIGLRVTDREELQGLDLTQHEESAYSPE
jgi:Amt family ammonium transporter